MNRHYIKEDVETVNKRMLRSLIHRETQIKTTVRHHHTAVTVATPRKTNHTGCQQGGAATRTHSSRECAINCTTTLENSLAVSQKMEMHWPYDPGIPLLVIHPRKREWCPFQDWPTNVPCSFLRNSSQPGLTATGAGLPKCGRSVPRVRLSSEWELRADVCNRMGESQNNYAKWRKPDRRDYILHGSMYMKVQSI